MSAPPPEDEDEDEDDDDPVLFDVEFDPLDFASDSLLEHAATTPTAAIPMTTSFS